MKRELAELFAAEGVVALREHRAWRSALRGALRRGEIVAVLRGIYTLPEFATLFRVRCHAIQLADPDAVLHGATAAALLGWGPEPPTLEVVTHRLHPRSWLRVSRRRLAPERIATSSGLRMTDGPTTALDNAVPTEGCSLDEALRSRVPLAALQEAAAERRGRRGVRAERCLLWESRDEPWSPAERYAHRLLHRDGIRGWVANREERAAGQRPTSSTSRSRRSASTSRSTATRSTSAPATSCGTAPGTAP